MAILAWRITWIEKPGGLQSMGRLESDRTAQLTHTQKFLPGQSSDAQHSIKPTATITIATIEVSLKEKSAK